MSKEEAWKEFKKAWTEIDNTLNHFLVRYDSKDKIWRMGPVSKAYDELLDVLSTFIKEYDDIRIYNSKTKHTFIIKDSTEQGGR